MTRDEERAIEHDCAQLVAHYANLNDASAWSDLADLFVADGRLARPIAPDDVIAGRDAILAAFQSRPARRTRHLCTNVAITATSDDTAEGECAIALFLADDVVRVGTFKDRFIRTDGGWRFAERRGTLTF